MATISKMCSEHHRLFQNSVSSFNLCVLVFKMAAELFGQIVKLFGPNYLINKSIGYFFWPREAVN